MKSFTSSDLKNRTGKVLRVIRSGESAVITRRGKPIATFVPIAKRKISPGAIRPLAETWADIERQLAATKPRFRTWREAERYSRSRE